MNEMKNEDHLVILDVLNMFCTEDVPNFLPEMKTKEFSDKVGETFRKVLKLVDEHKTNQPEIIATLPNGQPWIWQE